MKNKNVLLASLVLLVCFLFFGRAFAQASYPVGAKTPEVMAVK